MITCKDIHSSSVYGVNLQPSTPSDEYLNHLTMDMTALNLSQMQNEDNINQTRIESNHDYHNGSKDQSWFSGLVESRSSCETSNTYMYDSVNSEMSHDKLNYSYNSNISQDLINSRDLTFSNVNLPLFDYYPNYNLESDKMTELSLSRSHQDSSSSLNGSYGIKNSFNTQYYSSHSSRSMSPLEMSTTKPHRKPLYYSKDSYVFLKILATQLVSGTIIGRGGKGLNWFRRKSKVDDILLSMPWELYPKTEYRTLLLKGSVKSVIKSTCIISDLMNSRYSMLTDNSMLVMVVLPDIFLNAIDEIRKTSNPELLSITLFRDETSKHHEIVAVLKGDKSKVKDLVVAIATSITETVSPEKYCFVSYTNNDELGNNFHSSDSGSETIRRHPNQMSHNSYSSALKSNSRDDVDSLIRQIENAVDRGNLGTLSNISTLVKHNPELLSKQVDVRITLQSNIPEEIFTLSSMYKCDLVQTDREGDKVHYKITGQFAGCFATLLFILIKSPEASV